MVGIKLERSDRNCTGVITRCVAPLRLGLRSRYLPRTQPGKSARERDRVLDRDVIACHDDAFEQQPDEPLAALKVQLIQPCSECRGKGGEIVSEPVEPSASRWSLHPFTRAPGAVHPALQFPLPCRGR